MKYYTPLAPICLFFNETFKICNKSCENSRGGGGRIAQSSPLYTIISLRTTETFFFEQKTRQPQLYNRLETT